MNPHSLRVSCRPLSLPARFSLLLAILAALLLPAAAFGQREEAGAASKTHPRLVDPIDEHDLATLKGNVRADLATAPDLGRVEDGKPLHLFLLLQRTDAQQADLDNLILRQQQPTATEYHKWLTPKEFGARFGASPEDIAKIDTWLESHGFQIRNVLNNASMIDVAATAGQVRDTFHTELHYFNIRGGQYLANVKDPQIPAALAPVVAGIKGLAKIPPLMNHTKVRQGAYDKETHRWHIVNPTASDKAAPAWNAGGGYYEVTPQDLYTIYNVNPVFTGGNLAATATVAVVEESDIEYGTVNGTTGAATGGDVVTFRSLFGVPGTLNMHVYHGYGSVTCSDPGIDPDGIGEDAEASLDAEWINATAPSANLTFMSCDQSPDNGIFTSMTALIDNSLSDVMSLSYGETELAYVSSDYSFQDTLYAQAATQGQSFFVSAGDSGSDVADQNTSGTAISGINVSAFGSPLATVAGGTDFSDLYDSSEGGLAQSTYWGSSNSTYYGDALSYVPETSWNQSCASSIVAVYYGYTGVGFCATGNDTDSSVVGGSGGISTHYAVPAWQSGISGYSNSMHAQPDIAGFASADWWGHGLIYCDSSPANIGYSDCSTDFAFGVAGGTSFVAPYMAGTIGLLRTATGSRQGVLNPALYALGKAQYSALPSECYSNGQTSNTGVTTGLPAAQCIFNDITTSNNDVPCETGSTSCYVNSGEDFGMLSLNGSSSLSVAFPSTIGFDQVSGIGSVNVANLIGKWNTAFSSSTALTATPPSIAPTASTVLQATVTGETPTGYVDTPPALTGTATFKAGTTVVGSCTLSSGVCSASVLGSSFPVQNGANSVTATFSGSGTYPASTSSIATLTVTSGGGNPAATMTSPTAGSTLIGPSVTFNWTTETGATQYYLSVGSTGVGSTNVYNSGWRTVTSWAVTGLPTNGETLYVRLSTDYSGTVVHNDYTYTAATQAALTTPAAGGILTGPSVTFNWSTATGSVTQYYLSVGSTGVGSTNVYNSGWRNVTSWTADPLPTNGETLYVRLSTDYSGTVVHNDYTYTAATQAALTTPAAGSTLTGISVTFNWSAATGSVTQYYLSVGSTGVGSTNVYNSGWRDVTSWAADPLPTNGEELYVRLSTDYNGTVVHNDYTYTASTQAAVTSPMAGSILTGPSVTFNWSAATGATQYYLSVGSTGVGSTNVYNSGWRNALSWTATGLPTNGETLYVMLSTDYNGLVAKSNTTYLAATAAVLTTPAPNSTLSGSSVTFDWSAATGAPTQYYLSIGSTGVGSSNIYNSGWRNVTSWEATGLPTNGEALYVRLSTDYGGTMVHNDYTYTAH